MNSHIYIAFLLSLFLLPITAQSQKKAKKLYVYELDNTEGSTPIKTLQAYYEYNGLGKETVGKFYRNNEVTLMYTKKYKNDSILIVEHKDSKTTKYSYDELNRLKKKTTTSDGEITFTAEYWYDEADNLIKEKRSNGLAAYNSYDIHNNLISTINTLNGREFFTIYYKYNAFNQKVSFTKSNETGWNNYYIYDRHGNKVEFLRFNQIGELSQKITYEYDTFNRVIKEHNYDESTNEVSFTQIYVYE